jgi:hypothetical protein
VKRGQNISSSHKLDFLGNEERRFEIVDFAFLSLANFQARSAPNRGSLLFGDRGYAVFAAAGETDKAFIGHNNSAKMLGARKADAGQKT